MFKNFTKTGRIQAIDLIKLFAAFLVICGHCMMKYITNGTCNPIFNFIWLTQMPLFMFASGFVNNKMEKIRTIKLYFWQLLKNTLSLLVPCITYLLLTSLIDGKSILTSIVLFYQNPQTNLWFLWVLFIINLIFDFGLYISNKISNKLKPIIPIVLSFFVFILIITLMFIQKENFNFDILSLKLIAFYIPFYCFGYIIHLIITSNLMKKKAIKIATIIIIIISFIIVTYECFSFKSIYSFNDSSIKCLLIRVIGSVSSIIICVFVSDLLINLKFFCLISKFGLFSLESYYLHIIYLRLLNYSSDLATFQWLISFGTTLLLILMIALTLTIIYFIPYFHLLVFGKVFSFYKFEKRLPKIFQ